MNILHSIRLPLPVRWERGKASSTPPGPFGDPSVAYNLTRASAHNSLDEIGRVINPRLDNPYALIGSSLAYERGWCYNRSWAVPMPNRVRFGSLTLTTCGKHESNTQKATWDFFQNLLFRLETNWLSYSVLSPLPCGISHQVCSSVNSIFMATRIGKKPACLYSSLIAF